MSSAIVIRLQGGLGNQMFQYAAAAALAAKLGGSVLLDVESILQDGARRFELGDLRIEHEKLLIGPGLGRMSIMPKLNRFLVKGRAVSYIEPHFHFDRKFLELRGPRIEIEGYFQSEKYFSAIENRLRVQFCPNRSFCEVSEAVAANIGEHKNTVSIHVRRGDYVANRKTAAVHSTLPLDYYSSALAFIANKLEVTPYLFVFSDDIEAAAQMFSSRPNMQFVRTGASSSWEELFLMSQCDHHIIANSSYSWWGAWLNQSPRKIVVAPKQWFGPARLAVTDTADLLPRGWTVI